MFDGFFLKSWWAVLRIITVISAFTGIVAVVLLQLKGYEPYAEEEHKMLVLAAQVLMVLALVLPVIWQLIRNWLYTRYYLNYIVDQTREKAADYNAALTCDPKKGDKVKSVNQVYHDAIVQAVVAGNGDRVITPFLQVLESELKQIEFIPSLVPLLKYSWRYNSFHYPSKRRLKRLYKEYKRCNPAPKMEKFCKDHDVDTIAFRSYHQKQI